MKSSLWSDEIRLDAGWVDLISSELSEDFICIADFILASARISLYNHEEVICLKSKEDQKKTNTKNRGEKMNPAVIGKVADMVKSISDLCKKVIDSGDPEKYASSVKSLNEGVSDTYEQMRMIIVNSDKFTEEEKLERLSQLAKQEEESKRKCDEAIKGNRQQVANIALEVTKGLLTCGVCYVPDIAKGFKKTIGNRNKAIGQGNDVQLLLEENAEIPVSAE